MKPGVFDFSSRHASPVKDLEDRTMSPIKMNGSSSPQQQQQGQVLEIIQDPNDHLTLRHPRLDRLNEIEQNLQKQSDQNELDSELRQLEDEYQVNIGGWFSC